MPDPPRPTDRHARAPLHTLIVSAMGGSGAQRSDVDLPVAPDLLRDVLRAHGVVFALVFGSHANRRAQRHSDLDLAVWSHQDLDEWRLRGALPDTVDLLDLTRSPDTLTGRVSLTGVVVLDDDPPVRIRWQAQTRKRHLDEAFRRRRFQQDFVRTHRTASPSAGLRARG